MRRFVVVLGTAAVLAVGCDGGEEPPAETTPSEQPDAEPSDGDPADEADVEDAPTGDDVAQGDDGAQGEVAEAPSGEVLASTNHPAAEQGGSLDIELRAQEVGELLRVELTFTPRDIGDESTSVATMFGSSGPGNGMSGRLIDPVNLLEYETVRNAVAHGQPTPAYEGQPTTLYFYFAAPVEPMETFDFRLDFGSGTPDWAGFTDVSLDGA